jgi:SAM-dependent methyltransferase
LSERGHGFTRVDEEARPREWVECLDKLHAEPFYRDYKRRVREILAPRPEGLYLEVGAGAGSDARALGARVIEVDRSRTMCRESRARGARLSLVAEAEALPVRSNLADGAWSDRTFQHLADPDGALAELVRVVKPGGLVLVVDPDYGTQELPFPEPALARRVLEFRACHALRNGTLAHDMARRFRDSGLREVGAEERRLVVRDPDAVDHVLGLRSWPRTASARGFFSSDEVTRWEALYDRVVAAGELDWSVSFFLTRGCKPR